MSHSRAKLNPYGRRLLCERIESGFPVRVAARMVGISHARAYIIWRRYRDEGERAFALRSSRPHHSPQRTPRRIERRIERRRRRDRVGPRAIGWALGLARSTVYAVLRRIGLGHLKVFRERRRFRRYERPIPGDLVHIDTKKLPRLGPAAATASGSGPRLHATAGWATSISMCSSTTAAARATARRCRGRTPSTARRSWSGGFAHFAALGVRVRQLMSDNAFAYVHGRRFAQVLAARQIEHITTPPYTPRWNGKAEAFIKILLREVAYARPYRSEAERERAFQRFDHDYNFRRRHGELGGLTPMQRLADAH